MYYNIDMESEKNYFKQLSKKSIPKFNFHHADNQKQNILKNKKRKKQSWVIDKTKFKNSNTDNSKIRVAITLFIFFLFILMLLASNNITSGIISFLVVFMPTLPFLILALLISLLKK